MTYLVKFLFTFLAIFAIMFGVTLLTPKLSAAVDKFMAKVFKKNQDKTDDIYKVRSIYDAAPDRNAENTAENNTNGDVENGKE